MSSDLLPETKAELRAIRDRIEYLFASLSGQLDKLGNAHDWFRSELVQSEHRCVARVEHQDERLRALESRVSNNALLFKLLGAVALLLGGAVTKLLFQ